MRREERRRTAAVQKLRKGARAFWSAPVLWRSAIVNGNTFVDLRIKVGLFVGHERFVLIGDFEAVDFEAINRVNHGARRRALEPGGRAPRVLVGDGNEAMVHRVLVNIMEAGEVGRLDGEACFPIVEPNAAAWRAVELVDP